MYMSSYLLVWCSPFVGNAVGRDNYKFFVTLLIFHVLCAVGWEVTVSYRWSRDTISWFLFLYIFYAFGWLLMVCFLLHYHVLLISQNLTTNEHINMNKYSYMKDQYNQTDNPFDLKSTGRNCMDGYFPIGKQVYNRVEALQLRDSILGLKEERSSLLENSGSSGV
jgi:hypothetical protein